MTELHVIEGEARPHFKGADILRAAADFVDERLPNLIDEHRVRAVLDAAKVIVDAELNF